MNHENQIMRWFDSSHLDSEGMRRVSMEIEIVAEKMAAHLPHCAETTAGLRKLLEAKDCFVRAQITKGDL